MARISEFEFSGVDSIEIALSITEYNAMIAASGTSAPIEYTVQQYDFVVSGGTAEFEVNEASNANSSLTFDAGSAWVFDPQTEEWITADTFSGAFNEDTNFIPFSTGSTTTGYDSLGLYSTQSGTDTPIQMLSISDDGVPGTTATIVDGPMAGGSATIEHYDWTALAQPPGTNYLAWDRPNVLNPVFGTGIGFGTDTGVCFAGGTFIATDRGEVLVEDLRIGDRVLTLENGYKTINWIGCTRYTAAQLEKRPKLRPIAIKAGALGAQCPDRDLLVSRQHRILVQSKIAERMTSEQEVLVAACALLPIEGVNIAESAMGVEYFHVMCDQHEILRSNGAWTESLYTGKEALKSISPEARREIYAIMPELIEFESFGKPKAARIIVEGAKRKKLVERHVKNHKPMVYSASLH